jgi:hypothetical protein
VQSVSEHTNTKNKLLTCHIAQVVKASQGNYSYKKFCYQFKYNYRGDNSLQPCGSNILCPQWEKQRRDLVMLVEATALWMYSA